MMLVLLANIALWRGELGAAIEHGERARRRFQEIENAWGELQSAMPVALALLAMGRTAEAREEARRSRALSEQVHDPMRTASGALESHIAVRLGDRDAFAVVSAALEPELQAFDDYRLAYGLAQLQAGELDDAIATLERGFRSASESGVAPPLAAALGLAYVAAGRVDEALELHEQQAESAITYLDRIQFALLRAFVLARRDESEEARIAIDAAVAIADATEARLEQATTRLARASILERIGARDAGTARDDADRRLHEIGVEAPAWRRLFRVLAGT
jgi:tetratricopeptide (TPR) repeat protein